MKSRLLGGILCAGLLSTSVSLANNVELKVMSFNVWSAEDSAAGRQHIIETIQQSGADIIGFQEMGSTALRAIATSMGYYYYDQQLGDEAILSRYRVLAPASNRSGALVELAPGHEAWIFNTHLFHAPYGPYQLNGIAYFGGKIYDPAAPGSITSVVNDQIAARGARMQAVLQSATSSGALASGSTAFLLGDFNEASHLDWTADAKAAGVHSAEVPWPASLAVAARGFLDSWRVLYPNEVLAPGRTWSPVYPSTYQNAGDNRTVQPRPLPEPQDRIDFVYYAGSHVEPINSQRSGPIGGNVAEELEIANYPSDHNAITSTFRVGGIDDTKLTFRALGTNGSPIPDGYGNRPLSSPNVELRLLASGGSTTEHPQWKFWDDAAWPGGVSYLDSGNGEQADGSASYNVLLMPDAGFGVAVESFSLLDYKDGGGTGHSVAWELLAGGSRVDGGVSEVPPNGRADVSVFGASYLTGPVELRLTHLSGVNNELALDDLVFAQIVPEPPAHALLLAFVLMAPLFRRCNVKNRRQSAEGSSSTPWL